MAGKRSRLKYKTSFSAGSKLSTGDNGDYKDKGEQAGSGMVDRMDEDHEIKAESSGFAVQDNKYNS
jgi:hypothetical protein